MKKLLIILCSLGCLVFTNLALADWFLSSEVKALIVQAEAGDVDAQTRVGVAYDLGRGAPHDIKEAMKWYRMAAERGYAPAQNSVGSIFQAEKRFEDAFTWYEKAAAQGDAQATNSLAYLYDLGLGVIQDRQKAFEVYSRAADLGWIEAMWNISNMYGAGQLGEKDMLMACVWTMRTRKFVTPNETKLVNLINSTSRYLERTLSAEQLASCSQQADSWMPTFVKNPRPATSVKTNAGE